MSLTQFRALPTWRGDAYLLRSRRGAYLIDSGDLGGALPRMLHERGVGKLRAAVCTFPSTERLGGILDLLEAGYPLKECWLPASLATLASMADHFDADWDEWQGLFHAGTTTGTSALPRPRPDALSSLSTTAVLLGLAATACTDITIQRTANPIEPFSFIVMVIQELVQRSSSRWTGRNGDVRTAAHTIGSTLLQGGTDRHLATLGCRLLMREADDLPSNDAKTRVIKRLLLTAMAAALTTDKPPRVRHFRRTDILSHKLVPQHPFRCLNGNDSSPPPSPSAPIQASALFDEADRMSRQGRGLVFQYGDGECGALFCGESRFGFLNRGQSIELLQPTIITAPGQGRPSLDTAYDRILSDSPQHNLWVRPHYSYGRKVSDCFKRQQNKLCVNNCVHRSVNELVLEFDQGRWQVLAGESCICG